MNAADNLSHLLLPSFTNNFRAKLLHIKSLILFSIILLAIQFSLSSTPVKNAKILGYAANISPPEVIELTNNQREQIGLVPLRQSPLLEAAAKKKGEHMLSLGYWAHVAPDGTEPWDFFLDSGYKYRYAGENLARDFSNPFDAVKAWMASPTHRDNLLSPKYQEIGIAVVEGDLNGVDTTIIVQLFGSPSLDTIPAIPIAAASEKEPTIASTFTEEEAKPVVAVASESVKVSPLNINRIVSISVVLLLSIVLVVDIVVIASKKVTRRSSKSLAHISFLSMIAVIIWLAKSGEIL